MTQTALLAAIDTAFSAAFLFDPVNVSWQRMVVDAESDGAPLDVDAQHLFSFPRVSGALSGSPALMAAQIADAVAASTVVKVVAPAAGASSSTSVILQRREKLALCDDPELRTIFAKPVHFNATDAEVSEFFGQWGEVERVERRQYIQNSAERTRPSTFIVFKTIEMAELCVQAKPTYGEATTAIGSMFIPKLTVLMKSDHENDMNIAISNDAAKNARDVVSTAQNGAYFKKDGADDEADEATRFLRPGHTVKMAAIPAGSKWADIKAKLGNLGMNQPSLKKKVGVVQIVGDTCYAFCKTAEVARMLLLTYTAVLAGEDKSLPEKFVADFRAAVPNMTLLDGEEEKDVIRKYPEWAGGKVKRKQILNSKRARE